MDEDEDALEAHFIEELGKYNTIKVYSGCKWINVTEDNTVKAKWQQLQ